HGGGVIEGGDQARLVEAAEALLVAARAVEHLERDQAAQDDVARQEHVGLPARAEAAFDDVVADADDARRARRARLRAVFAIQSRSTIAAHARFGSASA